MDETHPVDPVELELMRNLYEAAAEEMGITLQRVAFSANIKERRDFSCALFDATGQLLAQAAHIPVHLGSMPESVQAVIDRLGALTEGDVAIVNDPFAGGTHLPDITIVSPIFHAEQIIAYAANRAHHADVGGATPGSMTLSRSIDEEGVRIEPSLLMKRGSAVEATLARLLESSRAPAERRGDLDAQLAANLVGAAAMARMIDMHGIERVLFFGRALLDYAQSFMARAIAQIPDGQAAFEDVLDDDGAGFGPVAIRCRLYIENDRAVVDLSGSDNQVGGCINCPEPVTKSAVYYCFACLLEESVPLNGGCFRNIDVVTRPGSVVHALHPAAVVAGNTETSQRIVDVVFGALAKLMPGIIPAASCGTMNSVALGGEDWSYYETIGGGSGASPSAGGASAVQCHMTNTLNTPAEALEIQYPLRVRRFERARGSGGAGGHAGGDGIIRELEALAPCEGTVLTDRRISRPYALAGGSPGASGKNELVPLHAAARTIPGKTLVRLNEGDVLRITTPGGGGFARPVGRDRSGRDEK